MALQYLATQEMVIATSPWLDPEKQRPLIASFPRLAPFLEDIKAAHAAVAVFQNAGKQEAPELAELRVRTYRLDAEHDRYTRAINHLLLGLVELSDDAAMSAILDTLGSELLPQGIGINQQSYLVQAGEVLLREKRLSDESKRFLASTTMRIAGLREVSLADLVERWHKVATQLGEAEAQKSRLKATDATESSRGPARRLWIRTISHFLQTLEMEKGMTDAQRLEILQPLREVEAKAAKKRAAAKKKNVPFDPDAVELAETP